MKPKPVELRLTPVDNKRLSNLCGALDENLRQIETALDISISRRGERFMLRGDPRQAARGRTLNHAFVILDEAQNTTPEQMKMFLTRMGFGSKSVITGDVTQVDLPRGARSGLAEARDLLQDVRGIAFTTFLSEDVVRHPLVQRIVDAYDKKTQE